LKDQAFEARQLQLSSGVLAKFQWIELVGMPARLQLVREFAFSARDTYWVFTQKELAQQMADFIEAKLVSRAWHLRREFLLFRLQ
jgi:hypothetical protein